MIPVGLNYKNKKKFQSFAKWKYFLFRGEKYFNENSWEKYFLIVRDFLACLWIFH